MRYNKLYNWPNERARLTYPWIYWDNGFTIEEIDKMVSFFDTQGTERGTKIGRAHV